MDLTMSEIQFVFVERSTQVSFAVRLSELPSVFSFMGTKHVNNLGMIIHLCLSNQSRLYSPETRNYV